MNKDFEKWILDGGNYPLIFTKMPSFVKEVDGELTLCIDDNKNKSEVSSTLEITINQKMKEWILNSGISEEFSGYHLIPEELIKCVSILCNDAIITLNGNPKYVIIDHVKHICTERGLKFNINNPIKIIDYNTNTPSFIWDGILKNIEECEYPEYYRITIKEERECDNNA